MASLDLPISGSHAKSQLYIDALDPSSLLQIILFNIFFLKHHQLLTLKNRTNNRVVLVALVERSGIG